MVNFKIFCVIVQKSWSRECIRFVDKYINPHCPEIENCQRSHICNSDKDLCFAVFKYDAEKGQFRPVISGCKWEQMSTKRCKDQTGKVSNLCMVHEVEEEDATFECCCSGNNCNQNLNFSMTTNSSLIKDSLAAKALVTLQGMN